MTLLIGTVSKNNIVLTSDGLSKPNPINGGGTSSSKYQKIFPLPDVPIAIAHHGFNILNSRPVKEIIDDFATNNSDFISKNNIQKITETFIRFVDSDVQITLDTYKGSVGFWVAGFSRGRNKAKLYEIFWPDEIKPTPPREPLFYGGSGKDFINFIIDTKLVPYNSKKVYSYNSQVACKYHETLYEKAEIEQTKQGENIFGGHKHQLVLTNKKWNWAIPP